MGLPICDKCGEKYAWGYMDCDGWYHLCEDCMEIFLQSGELIANDIDPDTACTIEDEDGGYYHTRDGESTGIFYTDWTHELTDDLSAEIDPDPDTAHIVWDGNK